MTTYNQIPLFNTGQGEDRSLSGQEIKKQKYLVNKLNYMHFEDRTIRVAFKHEQFDRTLTFEAIPEPCIQGKLYCLWADELVQEIDLERYVFQHIFISDDKELIYAVPTVLEYTNQGIAFKLPETCSRFRPQRGKRFYCQGIEVTFCQNSTVFKGELLEFSPFALIVCIESLPPHTFQWIDPDKPVIVMLYENGNNYYSGECRILSCQKNRNQKKRIYELEPIKKQVSRFRPKEIRSTRQELTPSPDIVFNHPLTKKKVILKVKDISGSGISVLETQNNAQLLPGLVLSDVEISFAYSLRLKCCIQVIYSTSFQDKDGKVLQRCGLAFLDMDMKDHLKLLSILQQALDENAYICNEVNMDELWNFLFETGFIYPEKYQHMQSNKKNLKQTYEKLYTQNPHIARHFIYQDNGQILGHMAMVRFYHNSWMIHHHAANSARSKWAGIKVLSQISRYVDSAHNLASAQMRYVFCYFRPNNRFPRRVFGGVADYLEDRKKCSLDTFAYMHLDKSIQDRKPLPENWTVDKPKKNDLLELEYFYEDTSYGLFLDAFELNQEDDLTGQLASEYHDLGFKKEKYVFSLKENNKLKAFFLINISDFGLNMSDLTNCIKVIVIDDQNLSQEIFFSSLYSFFSYFEMDHIPVLVYPTYYIEHIQVEIKKYYTLWILDLNYIDRYLQFCNRLLRNI